MTASIAQEFYKLRDEWAVTDNLRGWKLAVWVAEYPDVDLIDKFLETERSPIGIFNDLFFKFDAVYAGNPAAFEEALWAEFLTWFEPCPRPELDIYSTLLQEGYLTQAFVPDRQLPRTAVTLWQELVRFRSYIRDIDDDLHFCLYFPVVPYHKHNIADWFAVVLKGVPPEIRLVTIDYAQDRHVKDPGRSEASMYQFLHPKLDTPEAVKNEMKKDCGNYNTVDAEARFTRQVMEVMESTTREKGRDTPKEIGKLFGIVQEMNTLAVKTGGWVVAAQAYYAIKDTNNCSLYTDKAIEASAQAMEQQDTAGYPVWKTCMMLKAALLYGGKKRRQALEVYDQMADTATRYGDAFYVMEGRRLAGHICYELKEKNNAFEYMLLALSAGAYLDLEVRRQSTFLHAAHMAVYLAKRVRNREEVKELKAQLQEWLGDDWHSLLQQEGIAHAEVKRKSAIF